MRHLARLAWKQVFRLLIDEAERSSAAGQRLRLAGVLDTQKFDTLFDQLQQHIEIWFNNSMERVSGWYKRRVQAWTIGIAVCLTVALNVDSILIWQGLGAPAPRSLMVAQAEMVKQPPATLVASGTAAAGARRDATAGHRRARSVAAGPHPGAEERGHSDRVAGTGGAPPWGRVVPPEGARPSAHGGGGFARRAFLVRCAEQVHVGPLRGEGARGNTQTAEAVPDPGAARAAGGSGNSRGSAGEGMTGLHRSIANPRARLSTILAVTLLTASCARPGVYKAPVTKFRDASAVVIESTKAYLVALNKTERDHYISDQVAGGAPIQLLKIEEVQVFSPQAIAARMNALDELANYTELLYRLATSDAPETIKGKARLSTALSKLSGRSTGLTGADGGRSATPTGAAGCRRR